MEKQHFTLEILQFGKFNQKIRYGITIGNIIQENNGQFGRNDFINFSNPYEWNIIANPNMYSIPNTNNFIMKNGNSLGINFKISGCTSSQFMFGMIN